MLKNPESLANLDLNLLYTFRTFVESGTLRETAARLGRSQPTVSARLHQLEDEMGVALLRREGRQLQLTPFGRVVDKRLRSIFAEVRDLADHVRASRASTGIVRVGALHTIGVFVLAPIVAQFLADHPGANVELHYGLARDRIDGMHEGALDLAVGIGDPPRAGFNVVTLGEVRPVLVVPRNEQEVPQSPVGLQELASMDLFGYGPIEDPFFGAIRDFLERHRLNSRLRATVSHIETLKALVAAGAGFAILPDYTVRDQNLQTRTIEGLDFELSIWAALRPSSLAIPLILEFWTSMRNWCDAPVRSRCDAPV